MSIILTLWSQTTIFAVLTTSWDLGKELQLFIIQVQGGHLLLLNWRERAAFQRSAFGRSTAGYDVVATIFIRLFFFPPVFPVPPSRPFLIEGVLGSKNLFSKSCLERPKT